MFTLLQNDNTNADFLLTVNPSDTYGAKSFETGGLQCMQISEMFLPVYMTRIYKKSKGTIFSSKTLL